jgi:polyhydroxyalkanoate synthesis regulator phasin
MAKSKLTLKELRATAQRTAARGEGLVTRARKEAKVLLGDARRMRQDVQRRAERTVRDMERSAERMLGQFEARAAKITEPVLGKSFASRREMRQLVRRLDELEKTVGRLLASRSAAA